MWKWLSPEVFDWAPEYDGAKLGDSERTLRPHVILAHAEKVLFSSDSELSIADSILSLRRAINSRLKHLHEIYEFRDLFPKQLGSLERLEQVGLARPFLIKQLLDVRNEIEHNDAAPPSATRARELVDATWYFLRTTDSACKLIPQGVTLLSVKRGSSDVDPELYSWLSFRFLPGQHQSLKISGWLSLELLSETEQPGFLLLKVTALRPKGPPSADPLDKSAYEAYLANAHRGEDERFIVAEADVHPGFRRQILRLAFETL
jgi:hypothetical protein